jgi:hypothetical protein
VQLVRNFREQLKHRFLSLAVLPVGSHPDYRSDGEYPEIPRCPFDQPPKVISTPIAALLISG